MKIHKVTLINFRAYRNPTTIEFNDLTAFVGRNAIGKSTVLEVMDLFFNDGKMMTTTSIFPAIQVRFP